MRRLLVTVVVLAATLLGASGTLAAPRAQDPKPVIVEPAADAVVRGVVQVVGTATHPQFLRYEMYYAPWPVPSDNAWIFVGAEAHFQQQPLGLLGIWDSRAVPDGEYALRIRVVRQDSNYFDSEPRRVTVANTRPVETPTPEATATPDVAATETAATPVSTPVDAPPPTVMVDLPPTPTSAVSPTPAVTAEPSATPLISGGDTGSAGDGGEAGVQLFSTGRLASTAITAATYTVAAFGILILFFTTKALLVWLWRRMRP